MPAGASTAVCTLVIDGQRRCPPRTPHNQVYPIITLPASFSSGDTLLTTELRVTRIIRVTERVRLSLNQVFGSGGPRALQVAAWLSF